jgi:MarR family transcriptional regulator for hemolysin
MRKTDLQSNLGHSICMAAHAFERAISDELVPTGITFRQCQVLAWLVMEDNALSQVELADRMNIEPPTLVSVLDRMERDGLVSRQSCPEDRRKKRVNVLPKAASAWNEIVACAERVRREASTGLNSDEVALLQSLLGRIYDNLAKKGSSRQTLASRGT